MRMSQHISSASRLHFMARFFVILFFLSQIVGCYTFKGFSVDPSLETFRVATFTISAPNAPPNINQTYSESLKRKVSRESRLILDERDPDIQFGGSIKRFYVSSVSPEPGEFAEVDADYEKNKKPEGAEESTAETKPASNDQKQTSLPVTEAGREG